MMEVVVLICVLFFGVGAFLGMAVNDKLWNRKPRSEVIERMLKSGVSAERLLDGDLRITVASDGKQTHHVLPTEDARSWAQDILDMLSEETT